MIPISSVDGKAYARARAVKPEVHFMFHDAKASKNYFLIKRTDKLSDYVAWIWSSPDGEKFVHCFCYRGNPPIDSKTKLPAFEPSGCTHAAALVLFITEKEGGENG